MNRMLCLGVAVALGFALAADKSIATTPPSTDDNPQKIVLAPAESSPAQKRIRDKLNDPVTLEFVQTALGDVVEFLHDLTKVNIVLDRVALGAEGINTDSQVTIRVENIRLVSALNILLGQLNLTWQVKDDCLVITSTTDASNHITSRAYAVADLAANADDGARLASLVQRLASATEWGKEGIEPTIEFVPAVRSIVITGRENLHDRARSMLEQLRGEAADESLPTVKRIREVLRDPVTLEFVQTSLGDVMEFLHDLTKVNIVLDRVSLEAEGINTDTQVSIHVEQIPLQSALSIMLRQLNLEMRIHNECLEIVSNTDMAAARELRVYPVAKRLGEKTKLDGDEWPRLVAGLPEFQSQLRASRSTDNPKRPFRIGDTVTINTGQQPQPIGEVIEIADDKTRVDVIQPLRGSGAVGPKNYWFANNRLTLTRPQSPEQSGLVVDYFAPTGSLIVLGPGSLHREVENLIGLLASAGNR